MERTGRGLRNLLFDEIESLKSGKSNSSRAKAVAVLANTILKEVEVEMQVESFKTRGGFLGLAGNGMPLGTIDKEPEEVDIDELERALETKKQERPEPDNGGKKEDAWEGLDNKPRNKNLAKVPSPSDYENTNLKD